MAQQLGVLTPEFKIQAYLSLAEPLKGSALTSLFSLNAQ